MEKSKNAFTGRGGTLAGHAVGGVCPFAVKDGVEVYLGIKKWRKSYKCNRILYDS